MSSVVGYSGVTRRFWGLLVPLARALSNPARLLRRLLRLVPSVPASVKVALDLHDRPHYSYGMFAAATQAKALGIPAITCIEFGVGAGQGLLSMEAIAEELEAETGVRIEVLGFDSGEGLPPPHDYRDLPYLYQGGFYAMDQDRLRSRLRRARLLIGPLAETVTTDLLGSLAPLGFAAFDLDYYSSTMDSFRLLEHENLDRYLPRVLCYFDDLANADALQCEYTGEELAISDFNRRHEAIKIAQIRGLVWSRAIPASWNDQMYACHFFEHPEYGHHVVGDAAAYIQPLSVGV